MYTNSNTTSGVLDFVLRREWNKAFENKPGGDLEREYRRKNVKKLIRKVPKNTHLFRLVRNVTQDEASINTLRTAVRNGNMNVIKKLYRPEFFFDVVTHAANNANVINALIPAKKSPETLVKNLVYCRVSPFVLAHVIKTKKIPVEKFVNTSSCDITDI